MVRSDVGNRARSAIGRLEHDRAGAQLDRNRSADHTLSRATWRNRLHAAINQQRGENIAIQIGSELSRLRIRYPRQSVRGRRFDDHRAAFL